MYKLKKGWTKEKMKELIKKYNNGTQSYDSDRSLCKYANHDNNRCAVGCFIPDNGPALTYNGTARELLNTYSELRDKMPLSVYGMQKMQLEHDSISNRNTINMHEILFKWIDENVI